MKAPTDITIHIPVAIAALTDLNLIEKAITSHIYEHPHCSNSDLAMVTCMSKRGVEIALARLERRELIRRVGHGPARRLILLVPVGPSILWRN